MSDTTLHASPAASAVTAVATLPVTINRQRIPTTVDFLGTNVTGLVAGSTKLGDELALLYDAGAIARSVFATMQNATWKGTTFA